MNPLPLAAAFLLSAGLAEADAQSFTHLTVASGGTVTTAGTYVLALAANGGRNGCEIQNTSASVEYISTQGTPAHAQSIQLAAGGIFYCRVGDLTISDQISIDGTSTASFVAWAQ